MLYLNQFVLAGPILASVIVLLWLFTKNAKAKLKAKSVKKAAFFILIINLVFLGARVILAYFGLKNSTLGPYLLQVHNYFLNYVFQLSQPFLEALIGGLILVLIGFLAIKYYRRPIIDKEDLALLFLGAFVVGAPNVVVLLVVTFLLMVLGIIIQVIALKRSFNERLEFHAYWLLGAITIIFLNNFSFYQEFLRLTRLN